MKIFRDKDADLDLLQDKTIAVIGYGSQGRAQALNLRDSGLTVVVGLPSDSVSRKTARGDGFEVFQTAEATRKSDVVALLAPDQLHQQIFSKSIAPQLSRGKTLVVAHAYSVHFKLVMPPPEVHTVLVAPLGPGQMLREQYQKKKGLPCFIAVNRRSRYRRDSTPGNHALSLAKAYAKGLGCTRVGAILTSFETEAVSDLFGEQVVLCGGLSQLLLAGFETLVSNRIPPEHAYLECVQQIDLIVELIKRYGIQGMLQRISLTAAFGATRTGPKIIDSHVRDQMRRVYRAIVTGEFARKWQRQTGKPLPLQFATKPDSSASLTTSFEKARKKVESVLSRIDKK